MAIGIFLGVARLTRAYAPGDVPTEQLPLSSELAATAAAIPGSPEELKVGENFSNQTTDHKYRFALDGSRDTVHLHVAAEIRHGKIEWELVDPTGKVRTRIGTTEHGTMDSTDIETIKGEWLLRIKLEDATGKYDIHWAQ
jgi:hypothetical protein